MVILGGWIFLMSEVTEVFYLEIGVCEDRILDGPASGEKGSKGRN